VFSEEKRYCQKFHENEGGDMKGSEGGEVRIGSYPQPPLRHAKEKSCYEMAMDNSFGI
jgi:hypothetical protein